MLKVPNLRGKFICGPCSNAEASYTAREHLISYRLPRREAITINGLAAFCDVCGKYAVVPAIEDYNAELAAEAYAHPELAVTAEALSSDSSAAAEVSNSEEEAAIAPALSMASGDDYFNDFYAEDPSGQMEFTVP